MKQANDTLLKRYVYATLQEKLMLHDKLILGKINKIIYLKNFAQLRIFATYKRMRLYTDISAPPLISACA